MKPNNALAGVALALSLLFMQPIVASADVAVGQTNSPSLTSDDVGLSGKDFFRAYASRDREESEKARLYLLGVSDASESEGWCDYRHFSTATLQEFVFEYFKKLPAHRLEERASALIQEALKTNFPCKGKQ